MAAFSCYDMNCRQLLERISLAKKKWENVRHEMLWKALSAAWDYIGLSFAKPASTIAAS